MVRNCKGVTLFELMVTVGIVGILMALAIPAFDNQMKNSRIVSNANLVIGALNMARSEAVNRGVQVRVIDIANGWAVIDVVTNAELNRFEPDDSGITWSPSSFPDITYQPTGFRPFGSTAVAIKLVDSRGVGRIITVSPVGSTSVVEI